MWLADSMKALRPWISDFYLSLAKATATLLSLSRIQFQEAISRASDNFVMTSHAELSGLRHGWRTIKVAGKELQSPQEAVETCPNVRSRIWVRTLIPRSRFVKAREDFRNTLEAWEFAFLRAPLQSSMQDTRTQVGSAATDAYAQGALWSIGVWCSAETQSVTPGSYWWFQLEGSIADLLQSWHAGNGAQPLISCFELLAQLRAGGLPLAIAIAGFCTHFTAARFGQRCRRRSHHGRVHDSTSLAPLRPGYRTLGHHFPYQA